MSELENQFRKQLATIQNAYSHLAEEIQDLLSGQIKEILTEGDSFKKALHVKPKTVTKESIFKLKNDLIGLGKPFSVQASDDRVIVKIPPENLSRFIKSAVQEDQASHTSEALIKTVPATPVVEKNDTVVLPDEDKSHVLELNHLKKFIKLLQFAALRHYTIKLRKNNTVASIFCTSDEVKADMIKAFTDNNCVDRLEYDKENFTILFTLKDFVCPDSSALILKEVSQPKKIEAQNEDYVDRIILNPQKEFNVVLKNLALFSEHLHPPAPPVIEITAKEFWDTYFVLNPDAKLVNHITSAEGAQTFSPVLFKDIEAVFLKLNETKVT